MKLIIATPSPFARKARIALLEKGLAHEILVQNPWQTSIAANPLGKVPALLLDDGRVIHDSGVIVEYLETLGVPPPLLPADPGLRVLHRQIEALADGICEAVVLVVTERARPAEKQSAPTGSRGKRRRSRPRSLRWRRCWAGSRASVWARSPPAARSAIWTCALPSSIGGSRTRASRRCTKASPGGRPSLPLFPSRRKSASRKESGSDPDFGNKPATKRNPRLAPVGHGSRPVPQSGRRRAAGGLPSRHL
jgi:hypothetical protein